MTLLGAFSGGLWIIPLMILTGAAIFGIKAWKQHTGGSDKIISGKVTDIEGGKIPFYSVSYFKYFAALVVIAIIVIIAMYGDR